MAAKTRTKKSKVTLDSVLSTVERSFADLEGKMDRGFAAVAEDITDIKSKMASRFTRRDTGPLLHTSSLSWLIYECQSSVVRPTLLDPTG
jgi:hypothetical protein